MEKVINIETAKRIIATTGGAIFSVQFVKKDKTVRDMTCRLHVTKYLKGGENKCAAYSNLLTVYEMVGKAEPIYRNINFDTLRTLKVKGQEYVVAN